MKGKDGRKEVKKRNEGNEGTGWKEGRVGIVARKEGWKQGRSGGSKDRRIEGIEGT